MSVTDIIRLSIYKMAEPIKRMLQRNSTTAKEKVTRQQALEWCQNFLRGAWSTIDVDQMQMDRVPGGLSNYLYCCSLPDQIDVQNDEPRKVLLRIYGEAHRKHRGTLLIDSVVCTLLSERKLGPFVHGIFPDGRLEEFVESESLLASEMRDEQISQKIGRLLGELHQINMPLVKEPIWLFRTIERYLADIPTDVAKFDMEEDRQIFQELRSVCNFTEEFDNLKTLLSTVDSPVRFTHNDFQPGNILRLKSRPDSFTIIDFEYCSYNYRGFDIGNHFCEFMFDYKSATEWPCFNVDFALYPNEHQQMNFLLAYLDASIKNDEPSIIIDGISDSTPCSSSSTPDRAALARQIMREANYYALASNFFWALWAINMVTSTAIKFGYMEYARTRLTAYYLIRDMLTGSNGRERPQMPPQLTEDVLQSSKNPFSQSYRKVSEPTIEGGLPVRSP